MATFFILVTLLVVIAIFLGMIWKRARETDEDKYGPPTTTMLGDLKFERPEAKEEAGQEPPRAAVNLDEFDPGETLVYMRSSQAKAPPSPQKREEMPAEAHVSARLIGVGGEHKGESFPVPPTGMTVGRRTGCDLVLTDPRVSGRHAWIGFVDGKAILRDLKSTNGTFLNAHLNVSVTEATLRSGDTIFFGGHQGDQFRFVIV
jgi:hypothetical protein